MTDLLEQLKDAREQINEYLQQVQSGRYVDYDDIIPDVCNLLNDLYNDGLHSRELEEATYYFTSSDLVDDYIKHLADTGDTWRIKWYLQDVTDFGKYYYREDDGGLMNITNDDLETWLLDILDNIDYEVENFNS